MFSSLRLCGKERRRRKKCRSWIENVILFSPLPLSTLRTANCHQVDAESRIHENLEWIPLDEASTPVIRQYSANSSAIRVVESTHGAFIELQLKSRQIKLHTHLWFVETKSAARSGRNWFRIAATDWWARERELFTRNSLSIRTTCFVISTGLLSIWHWILVFTVRFPNRFQSSDASTSLN